MNKGFTLVELLAVVVIITFISILITMSVGNIIKDSKSKLSNVQKQIIEDATGMWIMDNLDKIPDTNDACVYITLGELKNYGSIDTTKDINTLENISNSTIIRIELTNSTKYNIVVDAPNTTNCSNVYN